MTMTIFLRLIKKLCNMFGANLTKQVKFNTWVRSNTGLVKISFPATAHWRSGRDCHIISENGR